MKQKGTVGNQRINNTASHYYGLKAKLKMKRYGLNISETTLQPQGKQSV